MTAPELSAREQAIVDRFDAAEYPLEVAEWRTLLAGPGADWTAPGSVWERRTSLRAVGSGGRRRERES